MLKMIRRTVHGIHPFLWVFILVSIVTTMLFVNPAAAGDGNVAWEGTIISSNPIENKYTLRARGNLTLDFPGGKSFTSGGKEVSPYSIMTGDRVKVHFSPEKRTVQKMEVMADYYAGSLLFINRQKLIISGGRQIYLADNPVFLVNGNKAQLEDIKLDTRVYLRVDPQTNLAGTVEVIDINQYNRDRQDAKFNFNGISVSKLSSSGNPETIDERNASFRCGQGMRVELRGTPGKTASLDIAGEAADIPLKEIRPGVYRGEYFFARGDVRRSYLLFRLRDRENSSYRIYPHALDIACSPPEIAPVLPAVEGIIRGENPVIYAALSSKGSMIDASSILVYLNGKQVTRGLDKTVDSVRGSFPADIKPGNHRVRVVVQDGAGNSSARQWSFTWQP
jgi:hypothetical protein